MEVAKINGVVRMRPGVPLRRGDQDTDLHRGTTI